MKKIFILFFLFCSCNSIDDTARLDRCLQEVIVKNNCLMSLEVNKDELENVTLKYSCTPTTALFAGKLLIDMYTLMDKENLKYDFYRVVDSEDRVWLELSSNDMNLILDKYRIFNKDYKLLINRQYDSYCRRLDSELYEGYELDSLKAQFDNFLQKDYSDFEGFFVEPNKSENVVYFSRLDRISGKRIQMVYQLSELTSIFGFTID